MPLTTEKLQTHRNTSKARFTSVGIKEVQIKTITKRHLSPMKLLQMNGNYVLAGMQGRGIVIYGRQKYK